MFPVCTLAMRGARRRATESVGRDRMRAGRPRSQGCHHKPIEGGLYHGHHSPLEGESQKPSRQAKVDAVGVNPGHQAALERQVPSGQEPVEPV